LKIQYLQNVYFHYNCENINDHLFCSPEGQVNQPIAARTGLGPPALRCLTMLFEGHQALIETEEENLDAD
jgi:hypothetical protein